jgi:hypothetical protein
MGINCRRFLNRGFFNVTFPSMVSDPDLLRLTTDPEPIRIQGFDDQKLEKKIYS